MASAGGTEAMTRAVKAAVDAVMSDEKSNKSTWRLAKEREGRVTSGGGNQQRFGARTRSYILVYHTKLRAP